MGIEIIQRSILLLALVVLSLPFPAEAAVTMYSQDFEAAPIGEGEPSTVGFSSGILNMTSSTLEWEFTANGGADDSKGMAATFNGANAPGGIYRISFGDSLDASDANPLANGPINASQIRFSVDAKITGNLNAMPLRFRLYQNDPFYEADRGIDANMDGDMTDEALIFESVFAAALTTVGDYNHLGFTLNQGQLRARITRIPPVGPIIDFPLTPQFDPTVPLNWSIQFGSDEFGFDAGNVVSVDNIRVEAVPEPSSLILALSAISLILHRRRN